MIQSFGQPASILDILPLKCHCLQAISEEWYYQMYYDMLPMWAFIGHLEKVFHTGNSQVRQYLITHHHFEIHYNGNNVIEVAVTPDEQKVLDVSEDALGDATTLAVEFSYSVSWHPTPVTFSKRLDHYHQFSMHPVHLEVRPSPRLPLAPSCLLSCGECVID